MGQINEILTGWGNTVRDRLGFLDEPTRLEGIRRLEICNKCSMRNGNRCDTNKVGYHVKTGQEMRGCGCNLSAKTLSPESHCPLGKW